MADWYGQARSNYFRVKDESAFRESFRALEVEVITNSEGKVGLLSRADYGGWPSFIFSEDGDEIDEEVDIIEMVSRHLVTDEVAVFVEVGAEKLRYLTGRAIAVNERNEQRWVDLDSIYEIAREIGENVTVAAY